MRSLITGFESDVDPHMEGLASLEVAAIMALEWTGKRLALGKPYGKETSWRGGKYGFSVFFVKLSSFVCIFTLCSLEFWF